MELIAPWVPPSSTLVDFLRDLHRAIADFLQACSQAANHSGEEPVALIAPRVPLCRMFAIFLQGPHWTLEDLLQAPPQEDSLMRTCPQAEDLQ